MTVSIKMKPMAEITLDDGSKATVERIGKGRFTRAWRNGHYVYLQTHEDDLSKDLLSRLAGEPRNKHIPECKGLGYQEGNSPYRWYRMPLYSPLTAKSGVAWLDYKVLHKIQENAWNSLPIERKEACYMREAFETLVEESCLSEDIKEAIRQLCYEAGNYGEYTIEISKRNCAVDSAGNLILLDPVFDLEYVRNKTRRGAR